MVKPGNEHGLSRSAHPPGQLIVMLWAWTSEDDMATETTASATTRLHALGQSLWLDNITRGILDQRDTAGRYIEERSVTGLTSNPTIFDQAIEERAFLRSPASGKSGAGQVRRRVCSSSSRSKICAGPRRLFTAGP